MKNFRTTITLLLCFIVFYSCKKETAVTQSKSAVVNVASEAAASGSRWQGAFISYNGVPASRLISDRYFIANGYARIYNDSVRIPSKNYYSTQFRLLVPESVKIKGDSVTLEVGVKNPLNSSWFNASRGRDVGLFIKGETDSAFINNVLPDNISPGAGAYAIMQIGNTRVNYVTTLQYQFEDWGTFILQTFNRGLAAYRNDEYLRGIAYYSEAPVGRLKEIRILFKGSGYLDYVRMYNSVNGKLLMSEEFNTDGVSTVVWY